MVPAFRHIRLSRLAILAASSVLGLVIVAVMQSLGALNAKHEITSFVAPMPTETTSQTAAWQQEMMLLGIATSTSPGLPDDTDHIALISPIVLTELAQNYNGLKASGEYTTETGAAAAIALHVSANVVYREYTSSDVKTDPDTSYARMLTYRSDLQTTLKPVLNNTEAEYALYGAYVSTGNTKYLAQLQEAARNYSVAAEATSHMRVPADAASIHLDLLNALSRFAATLSDLAAHTDDPIGSVALLRTYNDAESGVVNAFDALAHYARSKNP